MSAKFNINYKFRAFMYPLSCSLGTKCHLSDYSVTTIRYRVRLLCCCFSPQNTFCMISFLYDPNAVQQSSQNTKGYFFLFVCLITVLSLDFLADPLKPRVIKHSLSEKLQFLGVMTAHTVYTTAQTTLTNIPNLKLQKRKQMETKSDFLKASFWVTH